MARLEIPIIRTKKETHLRIGADIHISPKLKVATAVGLGLAGYLWLAPHFGSDNSTSIASAPQSGTSSTVPEGSHPRKSSTVPEAFQPGTHTLQVTSGFGSREIALGGTGFSREYNGTKPTDIWQAEFHPDFPTFTNGKPVDNPYIKGSQCTLINVGINASSSNRPEMVCTNPQQTTLEHHGAKHDGGRLQARLTRHTAQSPTAHQYRRR